MPDTTLGVKNRPAHQNLENDSQSMKKSGKENEFQAYQRGQDLAKAKRTEEDLRKRLAEMQAALEAAEQKAGVHEAEMRALREAAEVRIAACEADVAEERRLRRYAEGARNDAIAASGSQRRYPLH